jgi:hypothetical protein
MPSLPSPYLFISKEIMHQEHIIVKSFSCHGFGAGEQAPSPLDLILLSP